MPDFELSSRKNVLRCLGVGEQDSSALQPTLRKSLTRGEDGEVLKSTVMWTELYKPETIMDLVGNEGAIN